MEIKLPKAVPKKHNFLESDFQSLVTPWMKKNAWTSFPYELKISDGKTVAFSAFQPQQLPMLWKARTGIQHHKLSDISPESKPYDAYVFKKSPAYVGLLFNAKTNRKVCYFVDIADVMVLKRAGKKSISEHYAKMLGVEVVL